MPVYIYIRTKENMQQNTEFTRTCSLHRSWQQFVCCVQGGEGCFHLWFVK